MSGPLAPANGVKVTEVTVTPKVKLLRPAVVVDLGGERSLTSSSSSPSVTSRVAAGPVGGALPSACSRPSRPLWRRVSAWDSYGPPPPASGPPGSREPLSDWTQQRQQLSGDTCPLPASCRCFLLIIITLTSSPGRRQNWEQHWNQFPGGTPPTGSSLGWDGLQNKSTVTIGSQLQCELQR